VRRHHCLAEENPGDAIETTSAEIEKSGRIAFNDG
jgi:hypothetical protein